MNKMILFSSLFFFLTVIHSNAKTLTIAYENNSQPPYYMGVTTEVPDKNPGVIIEMLRRIEKRIDGIEIRFIRRPWLRCLNELEKNRVDGVFNSSYMRSRLRHGWYPTLDKTLSGPVDTSRRLTTISYSFYTLKKTDLDWNGSNFQIFKKPVGAPFGFSIVSDLTKKGIIVKEAYNTEENFKRLISNRIIAVALQSVTADSKLAENLPEYQNIVKLSPDIVTKEYYLMLSDKLISENQELAWKIWNTIKTIREEEFNKIILNYQE